MKACCARSAADFDARLRSPAAATDLEKLDQTLSNVLQFSPARALLAENFDDELERLYREHVARPPSRRGGIVESTRRMDSHAAEAGSLRARHLRKARARRARRGVHAAGRSDAASTTPIATTARAATCIRWRSTAISAQAKVLAYTAEQIRRQVAKAEFTAITEIEPEPGNRRHEFVSRLFEAQAISIVPLHRIDRFAEDLRLRLP